MNQTRRDDVTSREPRDEEKEEGWNVLRMRVQSRVKKASEGGRTDARPREEVEVEKK